MVVRQNQKGVAVGSLACVASFRSDRVRWRGSGPFCLASLRFYPWILLRLAAGQLGSRADYRLAGWQGIFFHSCLMLRCG